MKNTAWNIPNVRKSDGTYLDSKADNLKREARTELALKKGSQKHEELLEIELALVCKNESTVDYLWFITDLIRQLKSHNIIVGPGDGSSSSSVLCYALGISSIDPLKFELMPECSYNNLMGLPNININVASDDEGEVICYFHELYGNHFARVMRHGELLPKVAFSSNDLSVSKYASFELINEDDIDLTLVLNVSDDNVMKKYDFEEEGIITVNILGFNSLYELRDVDFANIPLDD